MNGEKIRPFYLLEDCSSAKNLETILDAQHHLLLVPERHFVAGNNELADKTIDTFRNALKIYLLVAQTSPKEFIIRATHIRTAVSYPGHTSTSHSFTRFDLLGSKKFL